MLREVKLLTERVQDWNAYPFAVPTMQSLRKITLHSRVVFFTGENGSGKSTLLEAVGEHYGFGEQGGNRNLRYSEESTSVTALAKALQLAFDVRTGAGFFLRAESFFNVATTLDDLNFRDRPLHAQSHGESFLATIESRMRENGLFLLDEPEAALSPQRQLAFLVLMHDVLRSHGSAQFVISTHSPILLGYPDAQILSFDEGVIREIAYEECEPVKVMRDFLNHREVMLREMFADIHEESV